MKRAIVTYNTTLLQRVQGVTSGYKVLDKALLGEVSHAAIFLDQAGPLAHLTREFPGAGKAAQRFVSVEVGLCGGAFDQDAAGWVQLLHVEVARFVVYPLRLLLVHVSPRVTNRLVEADALSNLGFAKPHVVGRRSLLLWFSDFQIPLAILLWRLIYELVLVFLYKLL